MISVCIATYNGEKYIKEQLDSILCQLGVEDEIIISDDGSTDKTIEIIQGYCDDRIKLLHHKKEENSYSDTFKTCFLVGRNAYNALKNASGDYIFLADQDDVWLEGKVITYMQHLKDNYDLVISDCIITDARLNEICPSHFRRFGYPTDSIIQTIYRTKFLGCCLAFNRSILIRVLRFPKEPIMHDIWIGLLACKYGKIKVEQRPYLLYRRHFGNVSVSIDKKTTTLAFKLRFRYLLIKAFVKYLCSVKC
jgi:glycosyltransferase involved in cell wall biosynthesis